MSTGCVEEEGEEEEGPRGCQAAPRRVSDGDCSTHSAQKMSSAAGMQRCGLRDSVARKGPNSAIPACSQMSSLPCAPTRYRQPSVGSWSGLSSRVAYRCPMSSPLALGVQ